MTRIVSHIVHRQEPVRAELSLNTQVPLIERHWLPIEGNRRVCCKCRETYVRRERNRQRVAARIICPWIGEIDVRQRDVIAIWRVLRKASCRQQIDAIVEAAKGRPNAS